MGHEIESVAVNRGHIIKLIIDQYNLNDLNEANITKIDAAIEFTTPETAFENVVKCLKMKLPVVSGTTGWLNDYDRAVALCREYQGSFIHSSNFSIGVNILFKLNAMLAKYMSNYSDYKPYIEEVHHTKKLDAPSGTAISLSRGISHNHPGYNNWCFADNPSDNQVPIRSIREGMIPGTHTITWDSEIDILSLRHEAKNRKGLALGAVYAAEYISSRKGIFTMEDILRF